jgi:hypothetical protein
MATMEGLYLIVLLDRLGFAQKMPTPVCEDNAVWIEWGNQGHWGMWAGQAYWHQEALYPQSDSELQVLPGQGPYSCQPGQ